jgi:hypothetical protein
VGYSAPVAYRRPAILCHIEILSIVVLRLVLLVLYLSCSVVMSEAVSMDGD